MCIIKSFYTLEFNNDFAIKYQVSSEAFVKRMAAVFYCNRALSFDPMASLLQLIRQSKFVYRLE